MELGLGLAESVVELGESSVAVPEFLVTLEPWPRVFLRNLGDLLWPKPQPVLRLASKPGDFWPDVFVIRPLPWGKFSQSAAYHLALGAAVWGLSLIWPRPLQQPGPPVFHHEDVIYYQASDYLPPLDTGESSQAPAHKGDPEHAAQPIISVTPEADNQTQTIVAPPDVKLNHDVPLPNVVAWQRPAPSVPMAATPSSLTRTPSLTVPVVAPPPNADQIQSRQAQTLQAAAVGPPPVVQAADIQRLGNISIGHMDAVAPAPQLSVPEQRTLAGGRQGIAGNSSPAVVPPPPSVGGAVGTNGGGRLIALSIHPVAPNGPVENPGGNRRGRFAAAPEGKAGARGTPDGANGDHAAASPGGHGRGTGAGQHLSGAPSGLYVGPGPSGSAQSAVGNGGGSGKGPGGSSGNGADQPTEMAKVTPPRVSVPAKETLAADETDLDKQVFGDRKSYAMTLNIPNLNSAGGSWVIHFAEVNPNAKASPSQLTAPVPTHEVDPGYPLELMRHNVRGTVVLHALIRKDGTVGDVQVMRGVDDTLDQYARQAFAHWRFQPATKDGAAVALEAVVSIPFRPFKRAF